MKAFRVQKLRNKISSRSQHCERDFIKLPLRRARLPGCSLMRALLALVGAALAQAEDCPTTTHHGELNLGVNRGRCYYCPAASQAEVDALCKAVCMADADCKVYEYAQPAIDGHYEVLFGGQTINCCVEHVASADFQNPVSSGSGLGDCRKEASCWSSVELSDSCAPVAAEYAGPCIEVECCVQESAEDIAGLVDWTAGGCRRDGYDADRCLPTCDVGGWSTAIPDGCADAALYSNAAAARGPFFAATAACLGAATALAR